MGPVPAHGSDDLKRLLRLSGESSRSSAKSSEDAEHEVQAHLAAMWREREEAEATAEPSLKHIPRLTLRKPPARSAAHEALQSELSRLACQRAREHMASLVLDSKQLDEIWELLRANLSPPLSPADERINYDDFCAVAASLAPKAASTFFAASHFLKLPMDDYGRISILHFTQWLRCKNSILRTRVELSCYDSAGDGAVTERELEQWVSDLLPLLPALAELRAEFLPFYKVTAVRKFFFFLDPKRRGRVSLKALLASPILHELFQLRKEGLTPEETQDNWFALDHAETLYSDYLSLDTDQNGMLCQTELLRFGGGGLTAPIVRRLFQEVHTYKNRESGQSEIDYKSYLDFVLAMTPHYKGTPEAIGYFFRLLDLKRTGKLTAFEVNFFFRAVVERIEELGEEPNCTVEDVQGEIFDMVKPQNEMYITLNDLIRCKVGDTVVGMLTDVHAFWQYDRREQFIAHEPSEGEDDAAGCEG